MTSQEPLPGMPEVPIREYAAVDPNRPRNALARALTEDYILKRASEFTDVTTEMIEAANPVRLREHLIDVPRDFHISPYAVSYTDPTTKRERYIAVTPQEASVLPRFVGAFRRNAQIGAAAKAPAVLARDSDNARAERAGSNAQESKLPKLLNYRESQQAKLELLDKFVMASRGSNIGLSMFGHEGNMRNRLAYLQTFIIDEMVSAYAQQRRLSESQTRQVSRTIEYCTQLHPQKFSNFHSMVKFLREYNGHKFELADQRIKSIQQQIGKTVVSRTKD